MRRRKAGNYVPKTYDKIIIYLNRGEKEGLKGHAREKNESINGFVKRLIKNEISTLEAI